MFMSCVRKSEGNSSFDAKFQFQEVIEHVIWTCLDTDKVESMCK